MRRIAWIVLVVFLAACGREDNDVSQAPALEIALSSGTEDAVEIACEAYYAEGVWGVIKDIYDKEPSASEIRSGGVKAEGNLLVFGGLLPGRPYYVYAVAYAGDRHSAVHRLQVVAEPSEPKIYPWELSRGGVPTFADLTIVAGGSRHKNPFLWDEARFQPHVSFVDGGKERWLFEAFLCCEGIESSRNMTFSIGTDKWHTSADREAWEYILDYWLGPEGAVSVLDKTVAATAERIGEPPVKRKVIMFAPDPIKFKVFTDPSSSTTYWGKIGATTLDFADVNDRIKAYLWYMDLARKMFNKLNPSHLELAGFYIISEELVATPDGWNYSNKQWDIILEAASKHLHERNEGLFWIPYYNAPGINMWKSLGIDVAYMQPNHYWDDAGAKPLDSSCSTISRLDMGMELEFEYSMVEEVMSVPGKTGPDAQGNPTYTIADVPMLRERFLDYLEWSKKYDIYGKRPLALYSGSNALCQLASSKIQADNDMYLELCRYIYSSPMRNYDK